MWTCELELQSRETELRQLSIQKVPFRKTKFELGKIIILFILLEVGFYIERFPR